MTDAGHLRWRDGAETRLESILRTTTDLSTASDDLAGQIDDWPTRYHLDRRRTNLLRPLHLGPGVRVLPPLRGNRRGGAMRYNQQD